MASSNLRLRQMASSKEIGSSPSNAKIDDPTKPTSKDDDAGFSLLDALRIIAGLILLSTCFSYIITGDSILWGYRPALTQPARIKAWLRGPIYLTDAELAKYDGSDSSLPIYLAINGSIYDVSVSPHFYGPGGGYSFFAGRDATRAYVTGCFDEDLTPDLRGVEEMIIPVEEDGPHGDKLTKDEKRERKLRQERERRLAKKKVRDTVAGWEKMFDGGKDGKYFWVGRVQRDEDWEKKLGPVRELCKKAEDGRPKHGAESEKR